MVMVQTRSNRNQARYVFAADRPTNRHNGLTFKYHADMWSLEQLLEFNHNGLKALKKEAAKSYGVG